jgi:hypothetical protein
MDDGKQQLLTILLMTVMLLITLVALIRVITLMIVGSNVSSRQ